MSTSDDAQSRRSWTRWLLVLAIWTAIYLPALGSLEIKGEEGRRILPAVSMLESGNFVVPYVGGEPYLRKPPLVNWLVAGSFKLFGARNEWTARLPSALCVLAVAVALLALARRGLGANGSLYAALMWLTSFGMIEKGRLIEIEALYVSLFALAMICWFSFWQQGRSRWLLWIAPSLFLGLGLLAKGPLHLLFFYSIVGAVLWTDRRTLMPLLHPAHLIAVAVMLGIFAAWAVPYLRMTADANSGVVWLEQFTGRVSGQDFDFAGWIWNIPRGLAYALPWVPLLVFLPDALAKRADRNVVRGLAWGIALPFLVVNLMPGALPRYTMPLLLPTIWLIAMTVTTSGLVTPRFPRWDWLVAAVRRRSIIGLSIVIAGALLLYAFALVPFLRKREKVRNVAAQIQAAIPPGERLYAIDPEYQPFLFYIRSPLTYVGRVGDLPADARFFVVQSKIEKDVAASDRFASERPREIARVTDYRRKTVILYAISGNERR